MRHSNIFWFVLAMFFYAALLFADDIALDVAAKSNAPLRTILRTSKPELNRMAGTSDSIVGIEAEGDSYILNVFIKSHLADEELANLGIAVQTRIGDTITARIKLDNLGALFSNPEIRTISLAIRNETMLDISASDTGTAVNWLGCNAQNAWTATKGQNVIVGIIDSGIDWSHPDFIQDPDSNKTSRILYIWDQTLSAINDETPPTIGGFSYGVEYPQSWISNELSGATTGKVRTNDPVGHGTHVAGIAGGDGSASDGNPPPPKYIGIAPEAQFIIIKSILFDNQIIDGVNYIFQRAAELGRPAVINLSLGNHYGPHDNTSDFESSLNALTGPGKLIVVAAGNSNGKAIHAESVIAPGGSVTTSFNVPVSPNVDDIWLDIWVDSGDTYNVYVTSPGLSETGTQSPGGANTWSLSGEGSVLIENYNNTTHPYGDKQIFIQVQGISGGSVQSGDWSFTLTRVQTGGDGGFDAWIAKPSAGIVRFTSNTAERETISIPGTAVDVITVGAHATKTEWEAADGNTYYVPGVVKGQLASFSSIGPTRETPSDAGILKPDITAPGCVVASAISKDYSPSQSETADDGRHRVAQGTSMAAPHVTGALALYLRMDGALTPAQARNILRVYAVDDMYATGVPNNSWGYGKLNIQPGLAEFTAARNWNLFE